MRRYVVWALLLTLVNQYSGIALAADSNSLGASGLTNRNVTAGRFDPGPSRATADNSALRSGAESSQIAAYPPLQEAPRAMPDYTDPSRYVRLIPKPDLPTPVVMAPHPIDLVELQQRQRTEQEQPISRPLLVGHARAKSLLTMKSLRSAQLTAQTTGFWPWWTYETRSVPGMGQAMVNVANLNLLLQQTDVDVPKGGLDLTFRRVYNSQSEHDASNDDGTTPSVFGNKWTNTFDIHLGWTPGTGSNIGTVSVYTTDGARDDYTCHINAAMLCTALTAGVHDLLATTESSGSGVACNLQWTKKDGTSYIFDAPYPACTANKAGYYGRLLAIYARNWYWSIQLTYGWGGNGAGNPENLAKITATHEPDGAQLILAFGQTTGSNPITELMTLTRPDGQVLDYQYDDNGNLTAFDKPGDNPVLQTSENPPTQWPNGVAIPAGNLPELYNIAKKLTNQACGPRAAITSLRNNSGNNKADGACINFDYTSTQLADWYPAGVLDPTPNDNVTNSPIQPNEGGWQQWGSAVFTPGSPSNGCTEMADVFRHNVTWCYNAIGSVTATTAVANSSESLTTKQSWDANNNLVSVTDPRTHVTNLAYDSSGNLIEMSLPNQQTLTGSIEPTTFIDYDSHNNITEYCDPANNSNNSWTPSTSDSLCKKYGTNYASFTWTTDNGEQYGCVTGGTTPMSYTRTVSYSGGSGTCGEGLPHQIKGTKFTQADGSTRQPTQTFTYNPDGTTQSYNPGDPGTGSIGTGAWQLTYSSNGMNRVISVADPDGITSHACYNQDGSPFYTETAYQNKLDNPPGCPTPSQLENGATPPAYAVAYAYDPDGDVATVTQHHACVTKGSYANCAAASPSPAYCTPGVTVGADTTCNYYDGLDRLVEVKLPYDSRADVYANPWMMRYWYDLTGQKFSFGQENFFVYGNLGEIQELLPSAPAPTILASPSPTPIPNGTYENIKATAYDGLDRPTARYASADGNGDSGPFTELLTWDSSILNANLGGYLGSVCNSSLPSMQQCQTFDYYPDGEEKTFEASDNSAPKRQYVYDADGRPTSITPGSANPQTYSYYPDGTVKQSVDASSDGGGSGSQATLSYQYYPDSTREYLSASLPSTLSQTDLFSYSYRDDGPLSTLAINDANVTGINNAGTTNVNYAYTNAGRLSERSESGKAAYSTPTTMTYDSVTGFMNNESAPETTLSNFVYTAESELSNFVSSSCVGLGCYTTVYNYSLRGELAGKFLANGVQVAPPNYGQFTWNDRMGVPTGSSQNEFCGGTGSPCPTSSWSYDFAGRLTGESGMVGVLKSIKNEPTSRTYDAENHLTNTTLGSGSTATQEQVSWGPNGHPNVIGTGSGSSSVKFQNERLHWDGDRLLFTTHSNNGNPVVDDIKVGFEGDIPAGDPTYPGLTFYDRAPGGAIMGCHHKGGNNFNDMGGGVWGEFPGISLCNGNVAMPTSTNWSGSPYPGGGAGIGQGGAGSTLGMPRTDGYTDGFDAIQGTRAYDAHSSQWTTPDSSVGSIESPMSLNGYIWNSNNPVANTDPSGYDDGDGGGSDETTPNEPEWCSDPTCVDDLNGPDQSSCQGDNGVIGNCLPGDQGQGCASGMFVDASGNCAIGNNQGPVQQVQLEAPDDDGDLGGAGDVMNAVGSPDAPCTQGAYGAWSCRGADGQPFPMPNIMGAGEHPQCLAAMMNPFTVAAGSVGGGIGGSIVGGVAASGAGGSVAVGIGGGFIAGSGLVGGGIVTSAVLGGGILSYTGVPSGPWGSGC